VKSRFRRESRPGLHRASAVLVALLLAVLVALPGCSTSKPGVKTRDYVIKQGGVTVGSEKVTVTASGARTTYETTETRPFMQLDTTYTRRVVASANSTAGYDATSKMPGATYHYYLEGDSGAFDYLKNEIITVDYFEKLPAPGKFYPFEAGSAGMLQPFIDTWRARGKTQLIYWTILPSKSALFHDAIVESAPGGKVSVKVDGGGDYVLTLDEGTGLIQTVTGGGLTITAAGSGMPASRPYQPEKGRVDDVVIKLAGGKQLDGSMYFPTSGKTKFPAAVIVPDTGPQDRTDSGVLSGMAEALAAKGIAVLICDKRGVPDSTGPYAYTIESESDNLDSQVDFLVMHQGVDVEHISVIGYGEGGAVAAFSANENPYVSACVFMATPSVRVFPDLRVRQAQDSLARGKGNDIDLALAQDFAGSMLGVLNGVQGDSVLVFGHKLYLGYMRSFGSFDIRSVLTEIHQPALVVQGGKDEVGDPAQAGELMSSLEQRPGGVQDARYFPALGHGFGPLVDEGASCPVRSHYLVDPKVSSEVAAWLSGH